METETSEEFIPRKLAMTANDEKYELNDYLKKGVISIIVRLP